MPILLTKDNQEVEVSDAETPALLASGNFLLKTPTVNLVTNDGEMVGSFDSTSPNLLRYLSSGMRLEHPDEERKRYNQEFYDNPLLAGVTGAARTATFGLSDLLGEKAGYGRALEGLKEENPISTGIGEIGTVAASLLTPGAAPSLLSKGLRGATSAVRNVEKLGETAGKAAASGVESFLGLTAAPGSKTLARALSKSTELATQGVVEGAFYGTGQLVSEHALGDTELNAERVLSEIGGTTLLSGALGGSLGAIIGAASPLAKGFKSRIMSRLDDLPVSKQDLSETLDEWSNYQTIKSTGILGGAISRLEKAGKLESSAKALRDVLHPDGKPAFSAGMSQKTIADRLDETVESIGREIGSTRDVADHLMGMKSGYNSKYFADKIQSEIVDPASEFAETFPIRDRFKKLVDDLLSTGDEIPGVTLPDGTPAKAPQDYSIRDIFEKKKTYTDAYNQVEDVKGIRRAYKQAERIYAEAMDKAVVSNLTEDQAERYIDLNKLYSDLVELNKFTQKRKNTLTGNRAFTLGDRLLGNQISTLGGTIGGFAGGFGNEDNPIGGALAGAGLGYSGAMLGARAIRTRLPSTLAVMFDKASRMMATEKIINDSVAAENKAVSDFVAQKFAERTIGRKLRRETVKDAKNEAVKASVKNGSPISDDATKMYVEKQAKIYASYMRPGEKEKIAANMKEELEDVAPQLTSNIINRAMSMVSFLASKAPKSPPMDLLQPSVEQKWKPSNQETVSYMRYLRAVNNPLSVLQDIQQGSSNPEGIEVLKTLYPSFYANLMQEILLQIADEKNPIPYNKRLMLSVMFGLDHVDPTMDPSMMKQLQGGITQQHTQDLAKQQQGGHPVRQAGAHNIGKTASQSLTTTTQRIEGPQQ